METNLKNLAEAIILQAIEDLWDNSHRKESIDFFTGEGFCHCSEITGMTTYEKLKLVRLIKKSSRKTSAEVGDHQIPLSLSNIGGR